MINKNYDNVPSPFRWRKYHDALHCLALPRGQAERIISFLVIPFLLHALHFSFTLYIGGTRYTDPPGLRLDTSLGMFTGRLAC